MFDVQNLDTMTTDELDKLSLAFHVLSEYADRKSCAIKSRKEGYVDEALTYESKCKYYYRHLPKWAQW